MGKVGFVRGSLVLASLCIPLFLLSVCTYDPKVVRSRQSGSLPADSEDQAGDLCGEHHCPRLGGMISDGEASFAWRRIPFALDAKRATSETPASAPSSVFRRKQAPAKAGKPYMSVPAENFRRPFSQ